MAVRKSKRPSEQPAYALPEGLDLRAASPLAADLLQRRGQDLAVNAAAVRQLGGQCLQVLLSARATWHADGHRLIVVAPSDEFTEALALLGAEILLAAPSQTPSQTIAPRATP